MGVMTAREFYLNKSSVLARAAAGETIEITKHGRPVARVSPIEAAAEGRRQRPGAVDAAAEGRPERGTPEWQAAYDRMVARMNHGFHWGGKVTYEDKHE